MAARESDKAALTKQFVAVFGTSDHPLHTKMQSDLTDGRSLSAVLTDLSEVQTHRTSESNPDDPRLYIAAL